MAVSLPMVSIQDACFAWGGNRVLDACSLDVGRGEMLCLMGPNGCGKSTLLDCVLGENRLASGSIHVDGRDLAALRPVERARLMAYVPQFHDKGFPYTVEHIVAMGRTAYRTGFGGSSADDARRVADALEMCGIAHLGDRACTELSGGEMQMALLARALVQDSELIVLDEPTNHLDFRNELVFLEAIERLALEKSVTFIMATHAPNQAFHLAAAGVPVRVAVMADGKVACLGTPGEVLTVENVRRCFGVEALITHVEAAGIDQLVPVSAACDVFGEGESV